MTQLDGTGRVRSLLEALQPKPPSDSVTPNKHCRYLPDPSLRPASRVTIDSPEVNLLWNRRWICTCYAAILQTGR